MAGHICQCLTKMSTLRRSSPVTMSYDGHRQQTGGRFAENVYRLALGLLELGVLRGDVVAIAAPNSDWYLEWFLAIAHIGGIVAPLNYRWSYQEAGWAMEDVGPVILVFDDSCIKTWIPGLTQFKSPSTLKTAIFTGSSSIPSMPNLRVIGQDAMRRPLVGPPLLDYQFAPEGIVLICFTSGTTGRPKGVAISHTALIVQSLAKIAIVGYGEDDVYLHTAPLCHIGGISSALAMLMVAGCHVFMPKFDAKEALHAIEVHHVTSFITVPAMISDMNYVILGGQGKWRGGANVKKILNGGGGLSINLLKSAAHIFPNATIFSAYGMTEASSSITFFNLTNELTSKNLEALTSNPHHSLGGTCVGKPAPHVELIIDSGPKSKTQHSGDVGPILTRGPNLMVRYWDQSKDASNSSSSSRATKWLDTGDVGYVDKDRNLWLVGRANDKIKTGGENVYPQEVEAIISQHPGISGVTVIGLPHPRLQEMVAACVRLQQNWRWLHQISSDHGFDPVQLLSSEILHNYCRERDLTGFKIPKTFIPWEKPFPTTTSGKIRRDEVKKEVISRCLHFLHSNL